MSFSFQAHADTATLLMKNVYTPLLEISSYKKSQSKKLYSFREAFEGILSKAEEGVFKVKARSRGVSTIANYVVTQCLQRYSQNREAANLHGVQGSVPAKGHSLLRGFSAIIPGKPWSRKALGFVNTAVSRMPNNWPFTL